MTSVNQPVKIPANYSTPVSVLPILGPFFNIADKTGNYFIHRSICE
jgi:hypothetical protein